MVADAKTRQRRWRLQVLLSGTAALVVVGGVGGAIALPHVQKSLAGRVQTRLSAEGVDGITVRLSGQDATISCADPLQDPTRTKQLVEAVDGVGAATLDASCTAGPRSPATGGIVSLATLPAIVASVAQVPDPSSAVSASTVSSPEATSTTTTTPSTTTTTPSTTTTTTPAAINTPTAGTVPPVTVPLATSTTTTMPPASTTPVPVPGSSDPPAPDPATSTVAVTVAQPAPAKAIASFLAGKFVLSGTVGSDGQRQAIEAAAATVVDPANVDDEILVDPTSSFSDDDTTKLGSLIKVMSRNILGGEAGFDGGLYIRGTYLSKTSLNSVSLVAAVAGARTDLRARPSATKAQADQLAATMSALVAQRPTLFNKNGTFTSSANATLDQLAAYANQYANLSITVRGYTDSDVIAARNNQNLSFWYTMAVIDALQSKGVSAPLASLARGVAPSDGTAQGKARARHVDFGVAAL